MLNNYSFNRIKYLCNLTFNTFQCPIHFISTNKNMDYSLSLEELILPIVFEYKKALSDFIGNYSNYSNPIFIATKYKFSFAIINIIDNNYIGSLCLGPFLINSLSDEDINSILNYSSDLTLDKTLLNQFLNKIPVVDSNTLINWICMLYTALLNNELSSDNISFINDLDFTISFNMKKIYKDLLIKNRQNTIYHHSNAYLKALYSNVRSGNIDKLLKDLSTKLDGELGVLAKGNEVRNKKNLIISLTTLCTQAAIDGGLFSDDAFTLSDSFIQTVESAVTLEDLKGMATKIAFIFTSKVNETYKNQYSKTTYSCINIILKHLYEDISLSKISEILNLSPQHISSLFKKDMTITLSEYILKSKIEEAKYLLTYTNHSILEISTLLCFHDQSYFTKTFKRFTGTTPKKYSLGILN